MIKSFYKVGRREKFFFDPSLGVRTTAYGYRVAESYIQWKKAFTEKWHSRGENFLLSEAGELGGNAVRGGEGVSSLRTLDASARTLGGDSVLPPLWLREKFFEAEKSGALRIGGKPAGINLGAELKAWAILSVPEGDGEREILYVVGKREERMCLTGYPIDRYGVGKAAGRPIPLKTTLEAKSFLGCFGRHVLLIHGGTLFYYYLSPVTGELERVPLGGGDETSPWCVKARGPVVADDAGRLFWVAGEDVYGFAVGYPKRLFRLEGEAGTEITRIKCFKNVLYLFRKERSGRVSAVYRVKEVSGALLKQKFNADADDDLFLAERGSALQYVKVASKSGRIRANPAAWSGEAERVGPSVDLAGGEAFLYFGALVPDVRYVGQDENKKTVCIHI